MYDLAAINKLIPQRIRTPICTVLFYTWPNYGYRVRRCAHVDAVEFVAVSSLGGSNLRVQLHAPTLMRCTGDELHRFVRTEIIKAVKDLELCHTS